jgi:hypothetical protein
MSRFGTVSARRISPGAQHAHPVAGGDRSAPRPPPGGAARRGALSTSAPHRPGQAPSVQRRSRPSARLRGCRRGCASTFRPEGKRWSLGPAAGAAPEPRRCKTFRRRRVSGRRGPRQGRAGLGRRSREPDGRVWPSNRSGDYTRRHSCACVGVRGSYGRCVWEHRTTESTSSGGCVRSFGHSWWER